MPDFEALIRNQQIKQPKSDQRLKVVDSSDFKKQESNLKESSKSGFISNLFVGFVGSVIGTLTILFLYINEYLPIELLKLK